MNYFPFSLYFNRRIYEYGNKVQVEQNIRLRLFPVLETLLYICVV